MKIEIWKDIIGYEGKYQFSKNGEFIKLWDSLKESEKYTSAQNISWCCRGKIKTSGGFIWKYFNG